MNEVKTQNRTIDDLMNLDPNTLSEGDKLGLLDAIKHLALNNPEFSEEVLSAGAPRDGTTKAFTKFYFEKHITPELERYAMTEGPISVAFVDYDHFKQINDNYGHIPGGDYVLRETTRLISENTRHKHDPGYEPRALDLISKYTSIPTRYGGDEMVIFFKADADGAANAAERIRGIVEQHDYIASDGRKIDVTLSIGVTQFNPEYETLQDAIDRADKGLYRAKKKEGRNKVVNVDQDGGMNVIPLRPEEFYEPMPQSKAA